MYDVNRAKTLGAAAAALVLVGLIVAAWVRTPASTGTTTATGIPLDPGVADPMLEARSKGSPDAPITIYELSDFQCPFCKMFIDSTWEALQAEYIETGKAKITFLNLPLISLHANAAEAHEYAMCAATQDQFWRMHDRLFETQETWAPMTDPTPYFVSLGEQLELDQAAFQQCVTSGAVRTLIAEDVRLAIQSGVNTTPTFIVEEGAFSGAQKIDLWRMILDSIYVARTTGGGS
jgi:protein-disulfide isomerase